MRVIDAVEQALDAGAVEARVGLVAHEPAAQRWPRVWTSREPWSSRTNALPRWVRSGATSSTRSCSSCAAGGEVELADQIGQAGAVADADMALDQSQPGAGAQPDDDARMAHEGRRLADGEEQELQRLLGVGTVGELDPGAGTGEGGCSAQ